MSVEDTTDTQEQEEEDKEDTQARQFADKARKEKEETKRERSGRRRRRKKTTSCHLALGFSSEGQKNEERKEKLFFPLPCSRCAGNKLSARLAHVRRSLSRHGSKGWMSTKERRDLRRRERVSTAPLSLSFFLSFSACTPAGEAVPPHQIDRYDPTEFLISVCKYVRQNNSRDHSRATLPRLPVLF